MRTVIRGNPFEYYSADRFFNPLLRRFALARWILHPWQAVRHMFSDHPILAMHHHLARSKIPRKASRMFNGLFLCRVDLACVTSFSLDDPLPLEWVNVYGLGHKESRLHSSQNVAPQFSSSSLLLTLRPSRSRSMKWSGSGFDYS